jgi:hypothetical protein
MGKKSVQKKQRQQAVRAQVQPVGHQAAPTPAPGVRLGGLEQSELFVRRDITRILIIMGAATILLIGLVIFNERSPLLFEAGKSLASFLRLS